MITECKKIRENILRISHASGHGHIPTCFSIVEILYSIYKKIKHNPQTPSWDERDIFILSKGHAALAHYCVLAQYGYFPAEDVFSFGSFKSDFGCHADRQKVPGIEASTGSLGHGIGLAIGMALAFKIKKSDRSVYTIIGDGESNEGTVWESVMVADSLNLDNLTIIYDNNQSHSRGLQIRDPGRKFEAFGCEVFEVNGHADSELLEAFSQETQHVKVIVANTIKGAGCRTLSENQYEWHRRSPSNEQLDMLMEELNETTI
jgi:transketolase